MKRKRVKCVECGIEFPSNSNRVDNHMYQIHGIKSPRIGRVNYKTEKKHLVYV